MQLSIILVSLSAMAMAAPAVKARSPALYDPSGHIVQPEGEIPFGDPNLPEGAAGNGIGEGIHVPENIDELAPGAANEWNGQDLGADILADLGGLIP